MSFGGTLFDKDQVHRIIRTHNLRSIGGHFAVTTTDSSERKICPKHVTIDSEPCDPYAVFWI